jgi:hypothetical protein
MGIMHLARKWTPSVLFSASEQGAWYDPSDFSTMFQDSAGTTPVTAVEQNVGKINDKSGNGNHASQSSSGSRPVLRARYNLLTYSEQFDNGAWTFSGSARTVNYGTAPDGTQTSCRLQFSGASQDIRQTASVGARGVASIWIKGTAGETVFLVNNLADTVPLVTLTGAWQRAEVSGPSNATNILVGTWGGATARDFEVWHPDLRGTNEGSANPAYQRIAAATDYDTVGFLPYLAFDGSDDFLVTGSIDPGAVDKVQVFAGARKANDTTGIIVESSVSLETNAGSFYLTNRDGGARYWAIAARGSSAPNAVLNAGDATLAPDTAVITGIADIVGDLSRIRRNGGTPVDATGDKGTGNFLAYPLYIGRRGGTTLPFNGRLYSLIVRFSAANLDAGVIDSAEAWINGKTGAY